MGQGLGDQDPALHPTGERHNFGVFLVEQGKRFENFIKVGFILRLAEQPS